MTPDQTPPAQGTPLTRANKMAALAESSERMNNLSSAQRQELHQHALKLIYAGAEIKELDETKKLLSASLAREAELAKALRDCFRFTSGFSGPRVNKLNKAISKLLERSAALQHHESQKNPKETKA